MTNILNTETQTETKKTRGPYKPRRPKTGLKTKRVNVKKSAMDIFTAGKSGNDGIYVKVIIENGQLVLAPAFEKNAVFCFAKLSVKPSGSGYIDLNQSVLKRLIALYGIEAVKSSCQEDGLFILNAGKYRKNYVEKTGISRYDIRIYNA